MEDVRLTVDLCAAGVGRNAPAAGDLLYEPVKEFCTTRWWPGEEFRTTIDREDFATVLDRVQIALESRVDGVRRTTLTTLSRDAITQGSRRGHDPNSYFFEKIWNVSHAAADHLVSV